ncbi:MAG: discoidin domain-containing protein, partial [Desulfuromonadales bacterium]|nr:discoidin domain-containing protein [Desulfuromonadales bacterium]
FQENCKQQLTELIRQSYNHPSIVFWGLYNESGITAEGVQELHDLAKSEDPSRLTTAASNKSAWKKHRVTDTIAWNKYPAWYGEFASISDSFKKTREKNPNMCIAVSEVGAGGCIDQHRQEHIRPNPMNGKFYPEEYQSYVHELVWEDVKDDKSIWGYFVWNGFDFSWPIVHRGNRPRVNHKGLITFDRKVRKDSFYFYQANWSEKPVLYLSSKRHLIRGKDETPVKVYSNVGAVTLKVNGKTISTVDANDVKVARWDQVTLKEGDNLVEVSAENEGVAYTDSVTWKYVPGAAIGEPEVSYTEGIYSASHAESGNGATKAFDGDMKTRWSSSKKGSWVGSELPAGPKYDAVAITWYQGAKRKYPFKVEFSLDGHTWDKAFEGVSSGKEVTDTYVFDQPMEGYHVRVTAQGNNKNAWSSIYEIVLRKSED